MKKILFVLTCTLIAFTQNISAQSLFGKLFVLSNGDQFGLVREMMFYADGTYLSVTATVRNNNFILDRGYFLTGNSLLFYTNKEDTTIASLKWLTEDAILIRLSNGEQYIYEQVEPINPNSLYLIPNIPHKVKKMKVCPLCHGSSLCSYCEGSGIASDYSDCIHCGTTSRCSHCHGTGKVPIN